MEQSRLDRVRISVAWWAIVEISWAERNWLLEKIRNVNGFETIVAQFEAVDALVQAAPRSEAEPLAHVVDSPRW
jgi:hypothetical protein